MKIEDYDKERATILNALYCSVRSAMETQLYGDPSDATKLRLEWIADELKVARQKLEKIEAEMRVLLGDPFAEDSK
jgi:hypothetical protein